MSKISAEPGNLAAPHYPPAKTADDVETLAGLRIPDPYRWLEDAASDEVQRWQDDQNAVTDRYVHQWPHVAWLRDIVERHTVGRFAGEPRYAGGPWFRTAPSTVGAHSVVVVAGTPGGDGHVIFDPADENPDNPAYLSWYQPSPDGTTLAVGVCADGSELNTIRLIDVATRKPLPAPQLRLMDNFSGGVAWLPDSTGFYITALDARQVDAASSTWFYRLTSSATSQILVPWTTERDYRMILPTRDGRHLVAVERIMNPIPVAVAQLDDPARPNWRPFITDTAAVVAGHFVGGRYVAVTDLDAPRGRLVAVELDRPAPTDWVTLVPESEAVLRSVTPVGDWFYLSELIDTYARVRIVDGKGAPAGEVPLPGRGALAEPPFPYMSLLRGGRHDVFVFGFSTLTSSHGLYAHRPGEQEVSVLSAPQVELPGVVVEDHWARSADGTLIPFHLLRLADTDPTFPQPALIHAYGGFNVAFVPQFPGAMAAFVVAGGILVHAHLRGGAEFGRSWWDAGRQQNKQNCYSDLYAVAEHLLAEGRTESSLLAVTGGSNGGLLSAVAVTQRPDLWAAAVPRVPLLDLLGACREPYGRQAVTIEFGSPDDPGEVARLMRFSPYHLVEDRAYPAVLLDAGDSDPRCPPWHARKLAARLQAAQQGCKPVLVRIWQNSGHGWATPRRLAVEQDTTWLAFVLQQLGVKPPSEPAAASESATE